jgi:TRAP-type C4-dicarboxylate transport system permease small subunit
MRSAIKINWEAILSNMTGYIMLAVMLICFLQVVTRYILLISLPWSEEVSRLGLVWATLLGACVLLKRGEHMSVEFLTNRLHPKLRSVLLIMINIVVLIMLIAMVWGGMQLVMLTWDDRTTSLGYPRNFFYWPIPVCGTIMGIYTIGKVINFAKDFGR